MFTLKDAARYSLVPHELGFCGPNQDCTRIFQDYLDDQDNDKKKIKDLLKKFPAVYFYCKQIAKANNLGDPLSDRVLEAYWIGNDLLKKAQYKNGGYPHHSYHVWQDKPFNRDIKLTKKLKNICEISVKKQGNNYYSFHWKQKIKKLNQTQVSNLRYYNKINKELNR